MPALRLHEIKSIYSLLGLIPRRLRRHSRMFLAGIYLWMPDKSIRA